MTGVAKLKEIIKKAKINMPNVVLMLIPPLGKGSHNQKLLPQK